MAVIHKFPCFFKVATTIYKSDICLPVTFTQTLQLVNEWVCASDQSVPLQSIIRLSSNGRSLSLASNMMDGYDLLLDHVLEVAELCDRGGDELDGVRGDGAVKQVLLMYVEQGVADL